MIKRTLQAIPGGVAMMLTELYQAVQCTAHSAKSNRKTASLDAAAVKAVAIL